MTLYTVDNVYSMLGLEEEDSGSDPELSSDDDRMILPMSQPGSDSSSSSQQRGRTASSSSSEISDNYLLGETSKFDYRFLPTYILENLYCIKKVSLSWTNR